jgi:hypothetical protein
LGIPTRKAKSCSLTARKKLRADEREKIK